MGSAMNPQDLSAEARSPGRPSPYGKHQLARCCADLPGNYLNWFDLARAFRTASWGGCMALMHEIDHNGLS